MPNQPQQLETLDVAQQILARRFDGVVKLEAMEALGGSDRSKVIRCRVLEAPAGCPASVVVKRALPQGEEKYDPNSNQGPAQRLFDEWAGLQFLNECFGEGAPIPRFYGGDRGKGVLVLEDLGTGKGLHTLLLESDKVAAENALLELFQVTGRMHAVSMGKEARFRESREALGGSPGDFTRQMGEKAQAFSGALEYLGLEVPDALEAEIEACVREIEEGAFQAYIHGDPCPDNCLVTEQGVKLLDFEFGQWGFALWDGAYARSHFPTCWCVNRIPAEIVERVEVAYRAELVKGCPLAADDAAFGRAVVAGCASALFLTMSWMLPGLWDEDGPWGISTKRQRVLVRLGALAEATERWGCFLVLGEMARGMEVKLRELWGGEEMPVYPAFR